MAHAAQPTLYGLMAEFDNPTALVDAATKARLAGYRKMDAYSPIPIEELNEALDLKRTRLPLLVLLGGIFGGLGGFGLEYWASVIAYPMNVGDRPLNSWPQFIPVTFETTVLGAALTCVRRHVGAESAAAAVSPGLQRRRVRARVDRSVLSPHRDGRPAFRAPRDVEVSRGAASSRSVRSCALSCSRTSTPNVQLPTSNGFGVHRCLGVGNWELGVARGRP